MKTSRRWRSHTTRRAAPCCPSTATGACADAPAVQQQRQRQRRQQPGAKVPANLARQRPAAAILHVQSHHSARGEYPIPQRLARTKSYTPAVESISCSSFHRPQAKSQVRPGCSPGCAGRSMQRVRIPCSISSDLSQLRGDILAPEPFRVLRVWIVQTRLSSRASVDLCLPIAYASLNDTIANPAVRNTAKS